MWLSHFRRCERDSNINSILMISYLFGGWVMSHALKGYKNNFIYCIMGLLTRKYMQSHRVSNVIQDRDKRGSYSKAPKDHLT